MSMLRQLADHTKTSVSRVHQIIDIGLRKLRQQIHAQDTDLGMVTVSGTSE